MCIWSLESFKIVGFSDSFLADISMQREIEELE